MLIRTILSLMILTYAGLAKADDIIAQTNFLVRNGNKEFSNSQEINYCSLQLTINDRVIISKDKTFISITPIFSAQIAFSALRYQKEPCIC